MRKSQLMTEENTLGQLYSDIFEKAPIGIYTLNKQGLIEMFNPRMLEIAGAKHLDQVIGLNAFQMTSYKKAGLTKFFRQGLRGQPFETEVEYVSLTGKKKTFRHYRGVPIYDQDKRTVRRLLLMVEDITESKQTALRLSASEQKYRMIFNISPEAILILDRQGCLVEMNPRVTEWLEYERTELIGQNIFKLPIFTAKSKTLVMANFLQRMAGKTVEPYELELLAKSGSKKIGIILGNPLRNDQGKIIADLVMVHDLTESRQTEAMKSEFVSIVSHQLRTPLTGIKWCIELLLKDHSERLSARQQRFLNQIAVSNERMIRLIEDLLNLSHIETGRQFIIKKKNIKITEVINHAVRDNMPLLQSKDIQIKLKVPADLRVRLDREKMENVWLNLIENALKYSGPHTTLQLTCRQQANCVVCAIKDQGMGIPVKEQTKIFDKFFRATNALDADSSGTGLGLYIVKAIIEAHAGKIWFKSQEHQGSTFFIALPK